MLFCQSIDLVITMDTFYCLLLSKSSLSQSEALLNKSISALLNVQYMYLTRNSIVVRCCTTQDLQTSKRTSWWYGKENSWIRFSDVITQHCTHFHGLLTWCLQNQKNGTKKSKKLCAKFPFFLFSSVVTLYHWGQDWVKVTVACFETCWNAIRDTTRAKFRCKVRSQCGEAEPPAQRLKIGLKALMLLFRGSINRLSDLNSLGDFAV